MTDVQSPSPSPITASLVQEESRLAFLPTNFGLRSMMRGEALVYRWMGTLCSAYSGGYWHYYTLSNGGFYLAPRSDDRFRLQVDNGFRGELSADAAGIVATLYALNQLAWELEGTANCEAIVERYYHLGAFARAHAEADGIFQAID